MHRLEAIPLRTATAEFHAVIETPRQSRVKLCYDKKTGLFRAKKVLALGLTFPFPFGFLPSTRGEDGDPLDVMVITHLHLWPGTLVNLRLLGAIKLEQEQHDRETVRNDRLIGVPVIEGDESNITRLSDIGEPTLHDIEAFLVGYQRAEGKPIKVLGRCSGVEAEHLVDSQAREKH
jgi:inorganic pyrophosphatase